MEVKKQKKINIKIKKLENINNIKIHYNGIYSKSTSKRI